MGGGGLNPSLFQAFFFVPDCILTLSFFCFPTLPGLGFHGGNLVIDTGMRKMMVEGKLLGNGNAFPSFSSDFSVFFLNFHP